MRPPELLGHYNVPPQFNTHPPVYVTASTGASGKSWYTTTQTWFGEHRLPLGTSNHLQMAPLQPLHVPVRSAVRSLDRVSPSPSTLNADSQPAPTQYGTHYSQLPYIGYCAPTPPPRPHHVSVSMPHGQAMAAPFQSQRPSKRPREDSEHALSDVHHALQPSPSSSLPTILPVSDVSIGPARKKPRYSDVVSVRGGRVLPTPDPSIIDARSMTVFTTLQQPPTRIGSMASITHFTLDSARAIQTINDLATGRKTPAESRPASAAPVSRASSSCSSLEVLSSAAESALRVTPTVPVEPKIPTFAPQQVSSAFERNRPGSPEGKRAPVVSPESSSPPPASPESLNLCPSKATQPLRYVVTAPAETQVSTSSHDAGLSSSLFCAGSRPSYRDRVQSSSTSKSERPAPELVCEEVPRAQKARFPSHPLPTPQKPQPPPARRSKKQAIEAVCPEPDSNDFKDDRPPKESVAELAVGAGPTYKMNKMKCLWPGCSFYDYPGELWVHIKDAHRPDAGRPKPSGNPVVVCNWAPGEPRGNRCTYRERASRMWEHFMAAHHKGSVKSGGEIMCRLGQCTARSKNLDFQRHLEDVHWKLEGTVRWCEGCGVWKRFDKGRLMQHFQNCLRKWMDCDHGFRQGLEPHEM